MEILTCENGVRVYPLDTEEKIHEACFCKMTVLYGLTGSGKTYVNDSILEALGTCIPKFLCYSATENTNQNYSKIAPSCCVFNSFNPKVIEGNVDYQDKLAGIWKQINSEEELKKMFDKVANIEEKTKIASYIKQLNDVLATCSDDKEKKKIAMTKCDLYKQVIAKYPPLNEEDGRAKKMMFLNPCMGLIIDDFAAELAEASKSKNNAQTFFRSLSMNGRHYMLSTMIMLQDTDALDSKMRRNVQTNIFTSPSEARSFFKNGTNAFSKEFQKEAEYVIKRVWRDQDYKVLVHCRDNTSSHVWNYIIGSPEAKPVLGCKPLLALGNKIKKTQTQNLGSLIDELK